MRKRRGNSRYIVIFLTVIIAGYIIFRFASQYVTKMDFFQVEEISFSGNRAILTAELAEAALPLHYKNLFELSQESIRKEFSRFYRIDTLEVKRSLPNKLMIRVKEKVPVFHLKSYDGKVYSIDKKAILIPPPRDFSRENLPFITLQDSSLVFEFGKKIVSSEVSEIIQKTQKISEEIPDFFIYFSEIYTQDNKIIFVEAEQGYRVIFDPEDMLTAAKEYMMIKDTFSFDNKTYIDMRQDGIYRINKLENQ